jgi:molybdopterin/thiamine biosynthesis adenylyltransferase
MDHSRHSGIFNCDNISVTIIGCGGIGASAAVCLAKMGVTYLRLYDSDRVNDVNLSTQLYTTRSVGISKVEAVGDLIQQFTDDVVIDTNFTNVADPYQIADQIVISAVDSIQARKDIWRLLRKQKTQWYLDARMAAEEFHLYTMDLQNKDWSWYARMLEGQSDETTPTEPCTQKATMFTSFIAAGHIGNTVKQIVVDHHPPARLFHNIRTNFIHVF